MLEIHLPLCMEVDEFAHVIALSTNPRSAP